jgi:hypothetical protein
MKTQSKPIKTCWNNCTGIMSKSFYLRWRGCVLMCFF